MPETIEERLKKIASKLNKPIADVRTELQALYNEEKTLQPSATDEKLKARATRRLFLRYKRDMASPAKRFVGVVLGVGDVFDIVAQQRQAALDLFAKEPDKAVTLKYVDALGQPLDNRPTLDSGAVNPRYGQPLPEHSYLRGIIGAAMSEEAGISKLTRFTMVLGMVGEKYKLIPNRYVPLTFRGNVSQSSTPTEVRLNASTTTVFEPANVKLPSMEELVNSEVFEDIYVELADMPTTQPNRVVVTQGDVVDARTDALPSRFGREGSRLMMLWDDGLPDEQNIVCFVPPHLFKDMAGAGSRVIIVGRTRTGRRRDIATQQRVASGININVMGIYPLVKVPLEAKVKPPEIKTGIGVGEEESLFG